MIRIGIALAVIVAVGLGVSAWKLPHLVGMPELAFQDNISTNRTITPGDLSYTFKDTNGKEVNLNNLRGKKDVVLVVMRGYPGYVCPYCSAQTGRFIQHYQEFAKRDAELLIVYPGPAKHIADFVQAAKTQSQSQGEVPFPVLLDEDFKMVERLGISGDMAKPSTFILDRQGQVRFAYVGATLTDRPSLKAILAELDSLKR